MSNFDSFLATAARDAAKDAPARAARRRREADRRTAQIAADRQADAFARANGTDTGSLARAAGYGDDIIGYLLGGIA